MERITSVEVVAGRRVRLRLTSGVVRIADLTPYLRGPIFEQIRRDAKAFRAVRVDPTLGTLVWPNGADLCPDVLVLGRQPDRPAPSRRVGSRR